MIITESGKWMMIGDVSNIYVFSDNWKSNRHRVQPLRGELLNLFLRVSDLLLPNNKAWNCPLVHEILDHDSTKLL